MLKAYLYQTFRLVDKSIAHVVGYSGVKIKCKLVVNGDLQKNEFLIETNQIVTQCILYDVQQALNKKAKYVAVPYYAYQHLGGLLRAIVAEHTDFLPCEIYRRYIEHNMKDYVVIALKNETGGTVKKSSTKGYAKKKIAKYKGSKCCFCNTKLNNENATAEHIIPFSICKNNNPVNFALSCKKCNDDRGVRDFYEYMAYKHRTALRKKFPHCNIKRYKIPV